MAACHHLAGSPPERLHLSLRISRTACSRPTIAGATRHLSRRSATVISSWSAPISLRTCAAQDLT